MVLVQLCVRCLQNNSICVYIHSYGLDYCYCDCHLPVIVTDLTSLLGTIRNSKICVSIGK